MDQQGLYDIYETWHIPFWQTKWFISILLSIGIITLITLTGYLIHRYLLKKKKLSLWDDAIKQIYSLADYATNKDHYKKQYMLLTGTLKKYLIQRYRLTIVGSTDAELVDQLAKCELNNGEIIKQVKDLFDESSMIKFANANSDTQIFKSAKDRSVFIIKQTIPVVEKSNNK